MITFEDIVAASKRIKQRAIRTPLLNFPILDQRCNGRVFLKAENLQHTGSFKFRGAMSAMSALSAEVREKGIVACSSGNHAQGIAAAAGLFGCDATVVMPADAPTMKQRRTKELGAKVVLYDRENEDRDAIALAICEESGAVFIHPYENLDVIAGQGTAGLEAAEQLAELKITPDHLVICAGGGGLASGVSTAMRAHFPDISIYLAEPEGFDDFARSLAKGERVRNARNGGSICDAIVTPMPGENAFEILRKLNAQGLQVSDDEALAAVTFALRELKLVVEPGGAVALAALLFGRLNLNGGTVVATLSGGNLDESVLANALTL